MSSQTEAKVFGSDGVTSGERSELGGSAEKKPLGGSSTVAMAALTQRELASL